MFTFLYLSVLFAHLRTSRLTTRPGYASCLSTCCSNCLGSSAIVTSIALFAPTNCCFGNLVFQPPHIFIIVVVPILSASKLSFVLSSSTCSCHESPFALSSARDAFINLSFPPTSLDVSDSPFLLHLSFGMS
ncbi:unnamed protein product [Protopolystoma xenopodis]|uniref:Uncharacterized protein n=1 Tax=Protopolystoma xenopodis TaxID=117903 RepID=A0A448X7D1_9PLAT|nr:unnamed protein product [Protopolystoma xenopodis]